MITENQILNSLKGIQDPDLNRDIVSLGFVKNIEIKGNTVSLDLELTTPACPVKSKFKTSIEEILTSLDGIETAHVRFTSKAVKTEKREHGLKKVKSIIAVASCKGGVGKSTIAANIAMRLTKNGYKTGLFDADIFGPSVPTLFNLHEPVIPDENDKMVQPQLYHGLKIMSFGFFSGDRPSILRGPMVSKYIQHLLFNVQWGDLDYLIIDMPPGTGDIQLTITQSVQLSGAIMITTAQSLSLVDVAKGIEMFETVNVPILGIIENMAYFICDGCHKKHYIFGEGTVSLFAEKFGVKTFIQIPIDTTITGNPKEASDLDSIQTTTDTIIQALGMSIFRKEMVPQFGFDENFITIHWNEGGTSRLSHKTLRYACPCAHCVNELTGEKIIKKSEIPQTIKPEDISSLGNYAIKIIWNDGHSSGIYSYRYIKKLISETKEEHH